MEAIPVLPSDEVDRLASQSAALSISGGVLGTRSGLPICTPEGRVTANFSTGVSTPGAAMRGNALCAHCVPLSASDSVLL